MVIPTFNRRDAILETLEVISHQDYPVGSWEVIVVDDGSTDGTPAAVEEWIGAASAPVRLIAQENAGPAVARNRGAAAALGEIVVFIDNDILVPPAFLRLHVECARENPGAWILGRVTHPPVLRETPFGRYRDDVWESFHNAQDGIGVRETDGITAANLAVWRADFLRIGGFDEHFTLASCEDCELGMRARAAGIRLLYNPAILVLHNDWATTLPRFCERQRMYSISDVLLWHKYGDASPRTELIRANAPIRWTSDSPELIVKKVVKRLLSGRFTRRAIERACLLTERWVPDSRVNRRAYELAVGLAIFHGVREGMKQYGARTRGTTHVGSA